MTSTSPLNLLSAALKIQEGTYKSVNERGENLISKGKLNLKGIRILSTSGENQWKYVPAIRAFPRYPSNDCGMAVGPIDGNSRHVLVLISFFVYQALSLRMTKNETSLHFRCWQSGFLSFSQFPLSGHPASTQIKGYLLTMCTQWNWLLNLLNSHDTHKGHAIDG